MAEPLLYVPVQRWKPAEQWAISKFAPDLREVTCPLVEICPPKFPKDKRHTGKTSDLLTGIARSIVDSCKDYRLFLDLLHLDRHRPGLSCRKGVHPLRSVFDAIWGDQLLFPEQAPEVVPVTGLSRSPAYRKAAVDVARSGRRLCVRLTRLDVQNKKLTDDLLKLVDAAALEPQDVDIVIDLEILPRNDQSIKFAERNVPVLGQWRSLTVLADTFPKDLRDFKPVGRHNLPRAEWQFFDEHVLQNSDLGEFASFGDYTIQHPVYSEPPKKCRPSASLRYALDDSWIIMKGEMIAKKGGPGAKQWRAQAKVLSSFKGEYRGPDHCLGCQYISGMANSTDRTGDSTSWLAATINHAMTIGAQQAKERLGTKQRRKTSRSAG